MQKAEVFKAQSGLTSSMLLDKLHQITADEFDVAKKNTRFQYYGKIDTKVFDIRNVKYSLYSSSPTIHGEIDEKSDAETLLNINIDIEEQNKYSNTILTFTIMVIAVSATLFSLGAQTDKLITLVVFSVLFASALCYQLIIKLVLKSTKKNELKRFLELTESKLI